MKRRMFGYGLLVLLLSLRSSSVLGVNWYNASDNGPIVNAGISASVVDDDIDIRGTNALVGGIYVSAQNSDILVTVNNGDAVITGSGNRQDLVGTDSARLYLWADTDRTITFSLTNDLLFRGAATNAGATPLDLMITASGNGQINFLVAGDQRVSFTSVINAGSGNDTGGTRFFIGMGESGNVTDVSFVRMDMATGVTSGSDLDQNVHIDVGPQSIISFLSEIPVNSDAAPTDQANLVFDPQTTGTGRMVLTLDNDATVLVGGSFIDDLSKAGGPTIGDLTYTARAGNVQNFILQQAADNRTAGLLVVNKNKVQSDFAIDPFNGSQFVQTGTRKGFVLDSNGVMVLGHNTYFDYVGTATNVDINPFVPAANLDGRAVEAVVKQRNPSAMIIDGNSHANAYKAWVIMNGNSKMLFRSGCDKDGAFTEQVSDSTLGDNVYSFTVDFTNTNSNVGNIVLDVEGELDIFGTSTTDNAVEVLSYLVSSSGGSVNLLNSSATDVFPRRLFYTYTDENGDTRYQHYNKATVFVNNPLNFLDCNVLHTDELHRIIRNSSATTEPMYIGGERHDLLSSARPRIVLNTANLLLHTSAAATGVDFVVANTGANISTDSEVRSNCVFYTNGYAQDNGDGRHLVLGTVNGSGSVDGTVVDKDAHLDVMQMWAQSSPQQHILTFSTALNDANINPAITSTASIANQFAVHSVFLGNNSNISVGTNAATGIDDNGNSFTLTTTPHLYLDGNYFAFETQGGALGNPSSSWVSGQGGMFVNAMGQVSIGSTRRAYFGMMVTKSRSGSVTLPRNQVRFDNLVGEAQWEVDLTSSDQRTLVSNSQTLADYTFNWQATTKDFAGGFVPYIVDSYVSTTALPVVAANLVSLPTVSGTIDQLQVQGSRIGDPAHVRVYGGRVKELIFIPEAGSSSLWSNGVVVLENDARVGLGSARRDLDSLRANITLGVNGTILIANGDATVDLNNTVLVDNASPIATGTAFSSNTLLFHSTDEQVLRVKNGGVLDLRLFGAGQDIKFGGNCKLVMEPGAKMVLGGGEVRFTDDAQLIFEQVTDRNQTQGTSPASTNSMRASLVGTGTLVFAERAQMFIPEDAYVGIEADSDYGTYTNLLITLSEQGKLLLGNEGVPGGALQVGNPTAISGSSVGARFLIDGKGAAFEINRQGFFGLGVGITDKQSDEPNNWLLGALSNLTSATINVSLGSFNHNQIYTGASKLASLLATGTTGDYTFTFTEGDCQVRGGGNIVHLINNTTSMSPTVTAYAGAGMGSYAAGIMNSKHALTAALKRVERHTAANTSNAATSTQLFDFLSTYSLNGTPNVPVLSVGPNDLGGFITAYRRGSTITRDNSKRIVDATGAPTGAWSRAVRTGNFATTIDASGYPATLVEIVDYAG